MRQVFNPEGTYYYYLLGVLVIEEVVLFVCLLDYWSYVIGKAITEKTDFQDGGSYICAGAEKLSKERRK